MRNSRVYADINLSAVLHNLEEMHKNISDETQIVAVIKTDAYGHGALPIAEAIEHVPYLWGYAVATVDEAMALIQDGRKKPILILEGDDFYSGFINPNAIRGSMASIAIDYGISIIPTRTPEDTAAMIKRIAIRELFARSLQRKRQFA